jgi:vacuolar-type H+-ATPase subunit H
MVSDLPQNSLPETKFQDTTLPAGPGPTDRELLQHLLEVEDRAAVLVEDAQTEADRRIAEHENQSRTEYNEAYARDAAELQERYQQEYEAIKAEYQNRLDEYRKSLEAMPVHSDDFSKLVTSLLYGER